MRYLYLILAFMILFPHQLVKTEGELLVLMQQNADEVVNIGSPVAGQAVQGSVVVRGSTTSDGFQSYEVDFAYSADPTLTWFLIQDSTIQIQDGILAVWDTTTITDGDYTLRLVVNMTNGVQVEVSVPDLRVRNYSPIETDTPTPVPPRVTLDPGIPTIMATSLATSTPTTILLQPTITPLPTNPAVISSSQVLLTFGKGVAITVGAFALLGAYLGIRTLLHDRK